MFTAQSLANRNTSLADAKRTYTCHTYALDDNNDGGSWKVSVKNYEALISSGRWGMVLREYYLHLFKENIEYTEDRLGHPLVPYGMRHMFGTMSPSHGMALEDYRELTGEYLSEESSGPHLEKMSTPHLFVSVNSIEDFKHKLAALKDANPTSENCLLKSLALPREIVSSLVFVNLKEPLHI